MTKLITTVIGILALLGTIGTALTGSPDVSQTAQIASAQEVSDLVDSYEATQPFRGTRNDTLPAMSAEGLELGQVTLTPATDQVGVEADGYVRYDTFAPFVELIAASDGEGMDRFGLVISEGGASSFEIPATVPEGSSIRHTDAGTIEVTTPDNEVTTLAPAIAVDAEGKVLPANYTLSDTAMQINVDLTDAAYPVLVDPVSSRYWWGTQTWYSRADVRRFASYYGIIGIANQACNNMPSRYRSICRATVGRYTGWISNTWQDAKRHNQCLSMRMTWTGQVIGIYRYACNWG